MVVLVGGLGIEVNVSDPEIDVNILKSNHEEADTIVVLHCIYTEAEHIVVSACDTDIAVLLAHLDKMECETLWLKLGLSLIHISEPTRPY